MTIDILDIKVNFGEKSKQNNQISFKCPYNKEETNFNDLFKIISILFPNERLCSCFKYEIENSSKEFEKNQKVNEYINSINLRNLSFNIYKNNNKECNCELYYKKSKEIL